MMDLRDSGEIAINFTVTAENADAETRTIVIAPPPTMGAYRRIRGQTESVNAEFAALSRKLRDDPEVSVGEMQSQLSAFIEDAALGWWHFVMVGDDSYKGRASEEPPDMESWPPYLASNESIQAALTHWKTVPLGRGGTLLPKS